MREVMRFMGQNGLAAVVAALAGLFTLILWRQTQYFPFALFIFGVLFSAWQGGYRAALFTTVFSTVLLGLICFSVPFSDAAGGTGAISRLCVLVVLGCVTAYVGRECLQSVRAVEQAQALAASARDAVIVTDADGAITGLNFPAQALVGWHAQNALHQPLELVLHLKHESTGQPVDAFAARVLEDKEGIEFPDDTLVISSREKESPIEGGAAVLLDSEKRATGMVITLRDVTRRRVLENNARQREQHLRALASKAGAAQESARHYQQEYEQLLGDRETLRKASADSLRRLREEYESKLREQEFARSAAEQAQRDAANLFERAQSVARTDHQSQFDALQQARQDLEQRLAALVAEHKQTEEDLQRVRESMLAQAAELAAERSRHADALQKARADLERALANESEALAVRHAPLLGQLAQCEASLAEMRQQCLRLEAAFDRCPVAIGIFDAARHVLSINRRFEEQFEIRKEDVLGRPGQDVLPAALAKWLEGSDRQALARDSFAEAGQEFFANVGARSYRLTLFPVRDPSGTMIASGCIANDLTDQKCAEQLLVEQSAAFETSARLQREKQEFHEHLIESCDTGIFAFDRHCRFTLWNPAMERISGFEKGKVLGKLVFEVFPVLEETGESRHFLDVLDGKMVRAESTALSLDGRQALLQQTFIPYQGEVLDSLGGIVFVHEIPMVLAPSGPGREEAVNAQMFSDYSLGEPIKARALGHAVARLLTVSLNPDNPDWLSYN
jgi:PAS domain S-box-containing protein